MDQNLSGGDLVTLLKDLADRIQANHTSTEGIITELRAATAELENKRKREENG